MRKVDLLQQLQSLDARIDTARTAVVRLEGEVAVIKRPDILHYRAIWIVGVSREFYRQRCDAAGRAGTSCAGRRLAADCRSEEPRRGSGVRFVEREQLVRDFVATVLAAFRVLR